MPHVSAPSPHGSIRRSAAPRDGPDTGRGEGRAPDGDPTAPTHTVVFFPPVLGGAKPRPGRGLVLDAQGSVTAKFTAGASADMIGACGGLICLLDARSCAVRVSNPVTGESLDLPLPPSTNTRRDPRAYCFGFDAAATRRFKIVHLPDDDYKICQSSASSSKGTRVVYVHSVGDKYWKPVRTPGLAPCCLSAGGVVYSDGAVYWLTHYKVAMARLVRFDLSEEAVAFMDLPSFDASHRRPLYCRLMDADGRPCVVTSLRHDPKSGEAPFAASNDDIDVWRLGEDGRWPGRPCGVQLRRLPRHVPGPQAVRRGHVLLQGEDGTLYAHRIKDGGVATRIERAGEKVLVEGSSRDRKQPANVTSPPCGRREQIARAKRKSVIPIMGVVATHCYLHRLKKTDEERDLRQGEKARADEPVHEERRNVLRTFGYVQPVSNASLAQHLGLGAPRWTHGGSPKGPGGHSVTVTPESFPPSSVGSVSRSCTPCNPCMGRDALAAAGRRRPVRDHGIRSIAAVQSGTRQVAEAGHGDWKRRGAGAVNCEPTSKE